VEVRNTKCKKVQNTIKCFKSIFQLL